MKYYPGGDIDDSKGNRNAEVEDGSRELFQVENKLTGGILILIGIASLIMLVVIF